MNITTIDRNAVKVIRQRMEEALTGVADDLGITVTYKGGSFDPSVGTFSPKVTFAVEGADSAAFDAVCDLYGFTPEDFGRVFIYQGERYKIVGLNTKAPKFPVQAQNVRTGKGYKFGEGTVRRLLG